MYATTAATLLRETDPHNIIWIFLEMSVTLLYSWSPGRLLVPRNGIISFVNILIDTDLLN